MILFIHIVLVTATFLTVSCEFAPEDINFDGMNIDNNNTIVKRYSFRDQQLMMFVCFCPKQGFIEIKYIPQAGLPISAGINDDLSFLYMKMTRAQHNSVVECHITDTSKNLKSIQKAELEMAEPSSLQNEDFGGFEVNGLILPQMLSPGINIAYPSYNEEHINIKFLYNKTRTNSASCKFDGPILKDSKYAGYFNNSYDFEVMYKNEYLISSLICSVINNANNKTDYKLILQNMDSKIPVVGLSFSKSLLFYEYNIIINNTIDKQKGLMMKYEYDSNSKLTCKPSLWKYNSSEVSCLAEQHGDGYTCTFNLISNHTKSIVQCYNMKIELNKEKRNEPAFYSMLATNDKNGI